MVMSSPVLHIVEMLHHDGN